MPFDKFIENFDPSAEDFDPRKFKEAALAEYKTDLDAVQQSASAKITTLDTELKTALEKVTKVQAHNYDLLIASGAKPDGGAPGAAGDGPETPKGDPVKSLFANNRKKE